MVTDEQVETLTRADLRRVRDGAARLLADAGVPSPEHDADALLAHAMGVPHVEWVLLPREGPVLDQDRSAALLEELAEHVGMRSERVPLQRIVGHTVFRQVTLVVSEDDDVFVPRPETEVVAQVAVDEAARLAAEGLSPLVVDLCCGSGPIAVSVDVEVPASRVVAVDASPDAVRLTEHNAGACGTLTQRTLQGDVTDPTLLADLDGTVDVVVSNPPYIPPDAVPVDPEVRDHEPDLALYGGGGDGLDVPRAVVTAAARLLAPGGLLVMEHAEVQDAAVRAFVEGTGAFTDVHTRPDLTGRPRMVVARRTGGARP